MPGMDSLRFNTGSVTIATPSQTTAATSTTTSTTATTATQVATATTTLVPTGFATINGTVTANLGDLNGSATAARQDSAIQALAALLAKIPDPITGRLPVSLTGQAVTVTNTVTVTGAVTVGNFPTTQAVDTVVRASSISRSMIVPVAGVSATISAGGAAHAVGDVLTLQGGTYTIPAQFTVASVNAGTITAVALNTPGSYTVIPASPVSATSNASGTGATITPAYSSIPTQIMPANMNRRGYQIQPQGATAYMNGIGNASVDQNSLKLPGDQVYQSSPQHVSTGAISIIAANNLPLPVFAREF